MSNGLSVIKLGFSADWKVLSHTLKNDPNLEVEQFTNASEAATYLNGLKGALVITSLGKKEDLIQIATLMKIYKKVAPDTAVKVVVVNFSGDKLYEKATAKLGIQDLLEPAINTKALKFKIDFWMKGLAAQAKKIEANRVAKAAKVSGDGSKPSEKKAAEATPGLNWLPPMDCEDDVWLLKNEGDCKRVLGKWLIRLMGPSPYVGQWTEVNGRSNLWKFEFRKEERDNFITSDGNWYFKGEQKPDFIWKDNLWLITGSHFELYYQDSRDILSRLVFKDKNLSICKNSDYAKTKEALIVESFDKEHVFKNDGLIQTNEEVDTDGGTDKFKNLEGKGKTDHQKNGPLSGKTKGSDDLSSELLAMDLDPGQNRLDDGTMAGPAGEQVRKGKQLELENSSNEHKKHWQGHNEAEQFDDKGPLSAPATPKARTGQELALENDNNEHKKHWKGHNEAEQYEGGDPLRGPAPEKHREGQELGLENPDNRHKTHWSGQNEYEKSPGRPSKENSGSGEFFDDNSGELEGSAADRGGAYGGKSSTDKLNKFYGSGEKGGAAPGDEEQEDDTESASIGRSPRERADDPESELSDLEREREAKRARKEAIEAKEREAQKRGGREADERDSEDSDDLGADGFSPKKKRASSSAGEGPEDGESQELDEKKKRGAFADEVSGSLGGRSSTDKLAAHYKNRGPEEENEEAEEGEEESLHEPRKKYSERSKEMRVKGGKPGLTKEDFDDLDAFIPKRKQEADSSEEGPVLSLANARKRKELERVLEDEKDPALEEATETAQVLALLLQNNIQFNCRLDDFFDQTIVFTTTEQGLATEDVELDLKFRYLQKDTRLNFKARVRELDDDGAGTHFITVEIGEESVKAFSAFMKLYQQRQKNIDYFLKRVKGL